MEREKESVVRKASNKMAGGARWKWWLLLALALAIAATNCTG